MLNETLFHNANGYIGVRSAFEEGYPDGVPSIRGSYINGFYDFTEMKQAEALHGLVEEKQTMLNVADTQGIRLWVEDEEFSMFRGRVMESSRSLDMRKGVTVRRVVWKSPSGREVELTVTRMASFALLPLFTIEYTVRPLNFSGHVRLVSSHVGAVENYSAPGDPRVAEKAVRHLLPDPAEWTGDISLIRSRTVRSGLSVVTAVHNRLSCSADRQRMVRPDGAAESFDRDLAQGTAVTLWKFSVFCDSIRFPDCRAAAVDTMKQALATPPAVWYERQAAYLARYWENCDVHIKGDPDLSLALRYNLFQLVQSVGKDPHSNICAKGLSGEGYEGHYFWDTEMYLLPFFSLCMPEIARSLIEYRYTILDAARENARLLGHRSGALFPWRTIMGRECSGYFPSGTAQYHIDGDIAYAVVNYYLLTGDVDFMARCGAEILLETARLWLDTGHFSQGRFRIHDVTGPDEYTCLVDNNYYTNVLAQYNLRWAVKICKILKEQGKLDAVAAKTGLGAEELTRFSQAADAMYLPYDPQLDINPQDDSFLSKKVWDFAHTPPDHYPLLLHYHPLTLYRHQVCKQADTVLAHFILEDAQSLHTMKHSFVYYEKITTHDSSLSTCIFSIMASRLGMPEKAFRYFGESAKLDLFDTHHNTRDGIHTANMGGNYMAIVYGFGGLRIKEDGLHFRPAIPANWESYDFRIRCRDSRIRVNVGKTCCRFVLASGAPLTIRVYERLYVLDGELTVPLEKVGDR